MYKWEVAAEMRRIGNDRKARNTQTRHCQVVAGTISHRNCIVYFIEIHSDHDNRDTVVPVEKICREDKNMPRRQTAVLDVIIVNDNIMGCPVCFRAAISGSKALRMDTASSFRNMST